MQLSMKTRFEILKKFRWVARGTSLLSILMLLVFFVAEGFDSAEVMPQQWIGLLFFPTGVIAGFIVSWRYSAFGGIISILSLMGFYFIYGMHIRGKMPEGFAFVIFTLPAFLFILCEIYAYAAIGKFSKSKTENSINAVNK